MESPKTLNPRLFSLVPSGTYPCNMMRKICKAFFCLSVAAEIVMLTIVLKPFEHPPRERQAQSASRARPRVNLTRLPVRFEPSGSSEDSRFRFVSRGSGYSMLLNPTEAVLSLRTAGPPATGPVDQENHRRWLIARMKLIGANVLSRIMGVDLLPVQSHYFLGDESRRWRTHVSSYAKVMVEGVYPGVDMLYYGKDDRLEFDFALQPGVDPKLITLCLESEAGEGGSSLRVDFNGDLVLTSAGLEIRQHKPRAYQQVDGEEKVVAAAYRLNHHNQITFDLGPYDASYPLIIDPVLSFSTSLAGSANDQGAAIAVDSAGNAYVAGTTESLDFLAGSAVTASTLASARGATDVFVLKIDAQTNLPVYFVYLGGSENDKALGIAVDGGGSTFVMGGTSSANFPVTSGAFQTLRRGASDVFVCKLDTSGSSLLFSSLLGGTGAGDVEGSAGGIALDAAGNVFVTGSTDSIDFPATAAAFQPFFGRGAVDAFVVELNPLGNALIFASYLGGSGLDEGYGVTVDAFGYTYVTGKTRSRDFPTARALQSARSGTSDDAFVAKVSPSGAFLSFSTYLGGSAGDEGRSIAVDVTDDEEAIYVTGSTFSTNFPTTAGAHKDEEGRTEEEFDNWDAFVVKLDPTEAGSNVLTYATYLGGISDDYGYGLALSPSRNVYVTGTTHSFDFPSLESIQPPTEDALRQDAFVTKVDPMRAEQLVYSTVLGGSGRESGFAIVLDQQGNAWVTGVTESSDFPTVSPIQPQGAGGENAFLAKISDGDGSPARPVVTSGVSLNPQSAAYSVGQEIIAGFTLTNRGGRPIRFQRLTLAEIDPNNTVPDFSHATDVVVDGRSSHEYEGTLTLTQVGTFQFRVAYQTDGQWHVDVPAEEGSRSSLQIAVEASSGPNAPENKISSSAENDECGIPFSSNSCSVTLTWSSVNIADDGVHVYVQDIGVGSFPSLFASGKSGTQVADWIQGPPHRYKFSLNHVVSGVRNELNSIIVTGKQEDPPADTATLYASANPCPIEPGTDTCTSLINWMVLDNTEHADVFVQDVGVGASRGLFAGDMVSGSVPADWIQGPPHRYIFTLYSVASDDTRTPLAAMEVTGQRTGEPGNRSGTIAAIPNPCTIAEGASSCLTTINWNTADHVTDARIAVRNVHRNAIHFFARGKSGSVTTDLIQGPPNRYIFILYELNSGSLITLDSVEVTGQSGRSLPARQSGRKLRLPISKAD
jgi:Beta-propeller repeat